MENSEKDVAEKTTKKSSKAKLSELEAELEKMRKENERMKDELFLAKEAAKESMEMVKNFKMDVDRIRERSEELNSKLDEKITMELAAKLIPTIDNFEKAFELVGSTSESKGFKMIYLSLIKALEDMKVKRIEVVAGIFDPNKMEAIMGEPTDNPELAGTISKVFSTGYYYAPTDKVIRYTQVAVFK